MLALLAASTVAVIGCGGDSDDTSMTGGQDMAMVVFKVQSGGYTVSNLVKGTDACNMALETADVGFSGSKLNISNNGQGHIDFGSLIGPSDGFTPQVYSQGSGEFTDLYHATTTMTTHATDISQTCEYDLKRDNVITVTGNNALHVEFTNTATNVTTCGGDPPGPTCTSTYTYDLKM
jgi:hypothetical protein